MNFSTNMELGRFLPEKPKSIAGLFFVHQRNDNAEV